jgi:hypothetical protein
LVHTLIDVARVLKIETLGDAVRAENCLPDWLRRNSLAEKILIQGDVFREFKALDSPSPCDNRRARCLKVLLCTLKGISVHALHCLVFVGNMEACDGFSEAFLKVRPAKLSVRDDRKADCFLSLYDFANCIVLERGEVLPADFRIFESPEGSTKLQRGREAADLIDAHFSEVSGLRVIWHLQTLQVVSF